MNSSRRVIGSEHIQDLVRQGRTRLEVLPGDIVTAQARESAERMAIALIDGPLEKPNVVECDGATAARRILYRRNPKWNTPKPRKGLSPQRLPRLTIVGAGGVGANIAHLAANAQAAEEIVLLDIVPGLAESVALDLNHSKGITRSLSHIVGSTDFALLRDSHVVAVTAGRPRTPGMKRSDLLEMNRRVIRTVAEAIRTNAPHAIVIVITNPLDEMTVEMLRSTGFDRRQILGMAGTLDSSRFRHSLAKRAGLPVADVEALILGSHGDEMTPIVSQSRIRGIPLRDFLSEEAIQQSIEETLTGGAQVVALRKTGSAVVAPAHGVLEVIDHMRGLRLGTVPVSVMLAGEYNIQGVVLGVPCHLGMKGLVEVEELPLKTHELERLQQAAQSIQSRLA